MKVTGTMYRFGCLATVALLATACAESTPTAVQADAGAHFDHETQPGNPGNPRAGMRGTTAGWLNGQTVTFFYNREFDCVLPAKAQFSDEIIRHTPAESDCVLAAEAVNPPRRGRDPVVYVLVPLFEETAGITLHCPVAGDCINHPHDIDASRVFGPDAAAIPLPPHSHIVDQQQGGWWKVEVNGVTTREAWDAIERAKNLAEVRNQQAMGTVTADLDTNLFLFFRVIR
jgi:hypothetical protein